MIFDLTTILSGATLALAAWTLFEVHSLRVLAEVHASRQDNLERRVSKLEQRAGL